MRLVAALEVQPVQAVSTSGGLGAYDMRPRRLVELGMAANLRREGSDRSIQVCDFVLPLTQGRFLRDPLVQYNSLARSMVLYHRALSGGDLVRPEGVSVAGALAILHVGGRGALAGWPKLFERTRARFDAAQSAF